MSSLTIFGSCIRRLHFVLKINPFTARVLDGVLKGDCNFCVCGRNPTMCDHSNENSLPVLSHGTFCFPEC